MKFTYVGYNTRGERSAGTLDAANLTEANDRLRREGLHVAEIKAYAVGAAAAAGKKVSGGGAGSLADVAGFTKQLSILLRNGTPLADALVALEQECASVAFRPTLADIRKRVEEGATLADALSLHSKAFDAITRSLVRAGEATGKLDDLLTRAANLARRKLTTRKQVVAAMVYPLLLSSVAAGVLTLMIIVVVPRFAELFKTLGVPLPATTKMLVGLSTWLQESWVMVVIALGGAVSAIIFFFRSPGGRAARDKLVIRLPVFGKIVRSFATAQFARLLGTLVSSGVQLLDSLSLTGDSAGNAEYKALIRHAEDRVSKGDSLSDSLTRSPLLSPTFVEAIRNAEQSGKLGEVLLSMADVLDEDNEITIRSLSSILEPLILVVLGVVVGLVAMSMFIPLFDLTAMTGQTGPAPGGTP